MSVPFKEAKAAFLAFSIAFVLLFASPQKSQAAYYDGYYSAYSSYLSAYYSTGSSVYYYLANAYYYYYIACLNGDYYGYNYDRAGYKSSNYLGAPPYGWYDSYDTYAYYGDLYFHAYLGF